MAVFAIVDKFNKNASIDDVTIPLIIFHGSDTELASIFQKLNTEGSKLTKYDVFAATWYKNKVVVKNDPDFIELVLKKYEAAQNDSDLEISGYNPEEIKKTGELTVFEYAFAIGKAIMNACPKLFPKTKNDQKNDSKIDSIGFLVLAELLGLTFQKMEFLAATIDEFSKVNYKALKDDIIESAKFVELALGNYIVAPTKGRPSLVCHSELQLISYIVVVFKLRHCLSKEDGLVSAPSSSIKMTKFVRQYLYKHYIYDILRGFWSGSGDSKLEDIISDPQTCRYVKDVDKDSFESVVREWLSEANKKKELQSISAETKLFLNYMLRNNNTDVEKREYDIEHCTPKKILKDYFTDKGISVPVSPACNLVYIPSSENRGKAELTYYQKQEKDATSYTLNQDQLDKLVYPRREELRFVESVDTLTEENYLKFLKGREQIVLKAFIGGLYSDN